ncbi:MAG: FHA domain-containing protein [Chloroflexota bacterium]
MKLVVLEGPAAHPSFEVLGERTLVGRAPDCNVLVYDAQVSRHHAQILRIGDAFVIESLQPSNPFIVNDRVISSRRQLADGDLIVMGSVVMEVDLPPASQITAREAVHSPPAEPALQPEPPPQSTRLPQASPAEATPAAAVTVSPALPPPNGPVRDQILTADRLPADRPTLHPAPAPPPAPARPQEHTTAAAPSAVIEPRRPPRARALPMLAPREQIKAMATRLSEAGQRLRSRADATPQGRAVTDDDAKIVEGIVADHERLGGDQELARLATLLSERLSNQTDIRALYRLGAEAAVLIAWSRIAQRSMEEASHLAQALGVH